MARLRAPRSASAWLLSCVLALAAPLDKAHAEEEEDALWEQLTEREDKRRPVEPFSVDLGGRPLTLGGEYSIGLGYLRNRVIEEDESQPDRLLLEQELELEAFYSFGPVLSIFAQIQIGMEEDLLPNTVDGDSDYFVQRGEMWLYAENVAGTNLHFDIGRLDFEDDRRWWWDEERDAVRLGYERETFEITVAVARELGSDRSDQSNVNEDDDRVLRVIGEASWDYARITLSGSTCCIRTITRPPRAWGSWCPRIARTIPTAGSPGWAPA